MNSASRIARVDLIAVKLMCVGRKKPPDHADGRDRSRWNRADGRDRSRGYTTAAPAAPAPTAGRMRGKCRERSGE